ncbi:MAG TPA: hypothetical protein VL172_06185, partial [Kofleriaceae bacterium]|nr:hypothetical protein [Kofleriaceae bacterium]
PAGSSDLGAALEAAAASFEGPAAGRERTIVYVGDGLASAGHRRTGALAAEAAAVARRAGAAITAVGIGGDADVAALAAIARSGGGFHVPWVPGQTAAAAAAALLETTYGVSLRQAKIELPAGLSDVAPTVLPTLRAGEEVLLAARFSGEVAGDVVLTGSVGGRPFVNRYPIKLAASTAAGNAFVPREWAALTIGELELAGRGEDRARMVALSKAYGVLSRETSLLVLESEEMFRAFAVDRSQPQVRFTGDEAGEAIEADGTIDYSAKDSGRGKGAGAGDMPASRAAQPVPMKAPMRADFGLDADGGGGGGGGPAWHGRMIAMRREYYRVGEVASLSRVSDSQYQLIAKYEQALAAHPDSRERHRNLVQALTYAGELTRAREVAARWLERDRVDPEALVYLSDIAGREGRRADALRLLSGVVDIQPDDRALHTRLAAAYERIGAAGAACAHRVTLAELSPADAAAAGAALRCQRALGRTVGAEATRAAIADDATRVRAETEASAAPIAPTVSGDLVVDATWTGGSDLELTIITPQGSRLSWMGGRPGVTAEAATDTTRERLALRRATRGNYLIEVSRARAGDTTPILGHATIRLLGQTRTLDFRLDSDRSLLGRATVKMRSRLVPL